MNNGHKNGGNVEKPEVRLSDLYQEVILDHNKNPRHFGKLENPTTYSHGHNPLCGDDYHLYLSVDGSGTIRKVSFEGSGCAISKASSSMLTELVEGKNAQESLDLKNAFLELLMQDKVSDAARSKVGKLKIFEGVKQFPIRVKCATLIWHALEDALKTQEKRS